LLFYHRQQCLLELRFTDLIQVAPSQIACPIIRGDGLLAVFPIAKDGGNLSEVCGRVLEAGRKARANVDAWTREIEGRGLDVVFAANPRRADGLSSSVRRAITLARYSPALLLLPVDLAALEQRDVARLISRWRAARRCVIARRIGQQDGTSRGGVPLILPRWLYARALAVGGDVGLRDLVSGLPAPQRVLLNLPSAALDVDTPQDLRAARRRLRPFGASL